jgi:hypothetical protein
LPGQYQQLLQRHFFIAAMCHSLIAHLPLHHYQLHDKRYTYIASKNYWPDYNKEKNPNSCPQLDVDTATAPPNTYCNVNTQHVTKYQISRYRNGVADDYSDQNFEGNTILRNVLYSPTTQPHSYDTTLLLRENMISSPCNSPRGPSGGGGKGKALFFPSLRR